MKKAQMLQHWEALDDNQPIPLRAIPANHKGSAYTMDTIRITGSEEFIDAVLSRVKDVLDYENGDTRLQVSYAEINDRDDGEPTGKHAAYISVRERGDSARFPAAPARDVRMTGTGTASQRQAQPPTEEPTPPPAPIEEEDDNLDPLERLAAML